MKSERPIETIAPTMYLLANALRSISLQNMAVIADALEIQNTYRTQAKCLNEKILETFWSAEKGVFYNYTNHDSYSQLGNSLAILCGAVSGEDVTALCEKILKDPDMTPVSLSMRCFVSDALITVDKKRYAPIILEQIEKLYVPMLEFGSTTVWETPIYYYHTLLSE